MEKPTTATRKVMITERALVQRINRALAKEDEVVKKSRADSRMEMQYGTYYSVNQRTNNIANGNIDIESMGRELGVLKEYEALITE
jgi:hypothetical protein